MRAALAILPALFLVAASASAAERSASDPAVRNGGGETVDTTLVELFAVVTGRGDQPVRGLRRDDFRVRLDGRDLPVQWFQDAHELPLVLGLVVDSSTSMGPVMDDTREAAHRFLAQVLDSEDRALLVDVDTRPRLVRGLTGDPDELADAFETLEVGGDTALYDAIALGVRELSRTPGRRALVALTDGRDVVSRWNTRSCRRLARRTGVPVYFLSLTGDRTASTSAHENLRLAAFARETGGDLYWIVSPDEIGAAYAAIETELRTQYVLGVAADRVLDEDELAGISIEVHGRPGLTVRAARRGVDSLYE